MFLKICLEIDFNKWIRKILCDENETRSHVGCC